MNTMQQDDKEARIPFKIEVPFEWLFESLLKPPLKVAGNMLGEVCEVNAQKFLKRYMARIENPEDGKKENLRVAKEVFSESIYTDDQVSHEYLSGILASSRSRDGKDDSMIYYLDMIKSLSSSQLMLHYFLYRALNELLANSPSRKLNLGQGDDMHQIKLHVNALELLTSKIDLDRDFVALFSKGLITQWQVPKPTLIQEKGALKAIVLNAEATPTTLGFQLYAAACNRNAEWRALSAKLFEVLPDMKTLKFKSFDKQALASQSNPQPT